MPFGEKTDAGTLVNFDELFDQLIKPAVEGLGIECIRADRIAGAGSIHAEMFAHIANDEVAVVDITSLNANVFYELGVRHALRSRVTVLIRRKGTVSPFNISGMRTIEYNIGDPDELEKTKKTIALYIENGLKRSDCDSPVRMLLPDIDVRQKEKRLSEQMKYRYSVVKSPGKEIGLITGDVLRVRGVDIWVNSENTNMQMARFFDRSLSSVIRFSGAVRDRRGFIDKDVIAAELQAIMETAQSVPPATVLATGSGNLLKTNGVKRIYHAASVIGEFGKGYLPIPNVGDCVSRALELAEEEAQQGQELHSILFPVMGAGTAQGDPEAAGKVLLEAAVCHFEDHPDSAIRQAFFLITRAETLDIWQATLAGLSHRVTPVAADAADAAR